ncbi:MAG: BON domain-containing protein [Zoogloeaceae bacterium]|jgi:osmotically-inducible protein OsmY|nr:BON domain-containing protein [Zoogloeaceae bacterium]
MTHPLPSPSRRFFFAATAAAVTLPLLSGCFGLALTGATVGVLAVTDRRSLGVQTDDETIELKASARLSKDIKDKSHVNFTSYNRRVLLTGEVPDDATKTRVAEETRRVENVEAVWNELSVSGVSSLASRSNDTYVTAKMKGRFVDANTFSAHHVKVVTEAGIAYLLGIVNQREADAAIHVARTTQGVRKVVSVMQIGTDAEIRRIDASIANSADSTSGK